MSSLLYRIREFLEAELEEVEVSEVEAAAENSQPYSETEKICQSSLSRVTGPY